MQELLEKIFPNTMDKLPEFGKSIVDTLIMLGISGVISFFLGVFFGVILVITQKGGILQNKVVYKILDILVNFFRGIQFVILLTWIMPVTRGIVGTSIGIKGAIVPLVFGTVPFFARQVQSALLEIPSGVIEASKAMGLSPLAIIFKVYLKEGIPSIARATTLTSISLLGLTAMAGAVGAGGVGDFAIRYGHNRFQEDVTWASVIVIVVIVSVLQIIGDIIVRKNTH